MFYVRKSAFDPSFVEICEGNKMVEEVAFSHPIKESPLFETVQAAKDWLFEEERKSARRKAVYALARRDLASGILHQKLKEKGFSHEAIEAATVGLPLDDAAFWERTIEREWNRGYGPYKIAAKWSIKGMPKHLAFSKITPEMQEEAIKAAFANGKDRAKVARSLVSKGFDASLVEKFFRVAHS